MSKISVLVDALLLPEGGDQQNVKTNINITNKRTSSNTIYRLPTSQLLQKRVENHMGLYNRRGLVLAQ